MSQDPKVKALSDLLQALEAKASADMKTALVTKKFFDIKAGQQIGNKKLQVYALVFLSVVLAVCVPIVLYFRFG